MQAATGGALVDAHALPDIGAVHAARERLASAMHVTPVLRSATLSAMTGCDIHLKCENLQKTGSFKSRGALNAVMQLTREEKAAGVVTVSAGNHAQALAWAAAAAGISCTVVMPKAATRSKVDASEGYGAQVVFEENATTAFERAHQIAAQDKRTLVHPFDDSRIIAGAGVVGLEVLEQLRDVEAVIVPVGGGGLLSGVALAVKSLKPDVLVFGIEPAGADAMYRSLKAGHPVRLDRPPQTIADGLAAPMAGQLTYPMTQRYVDDIIIIDDAAIARAARLTVLRTKLLVEPAGAAGIAALLEGALQQTRGKKTLVILSGGNVDLERLAQLN